MTQKKILLIVPPTGKYIREDRCQTPIKELKTIALRPPIDLLYAAAGFIAGGGECRIKDYPAIDGTWQDVEKDISDFRPDFLVLSITTPSLDDDMQCATLAKKIAAAQKLNITVIAKGAHFNVLHHSTLEKYPDLDMTIRGEYEETCKELAAGIPFENIKGISFKKDGKIIENEARQFIEDLDSIPFPARHLIDNSLYIRPDTGEIQTTIITNRGCPFNCIFCLANQVAGRKNRKRSTDNILAEIRECVEKYNITSFLFRSDLFTANKEWTIELCRKIKAAGLNISWACNSRVDTIDEEILKEMKDTGCWVIAYGIESGDQNSLDKMRKKTNLTKAENALKITRKAGIKSSIYLLFGFPWDNDDSLKKSVDFACKINPDFLEIFYVYPFPGTDLYQKCVDEGIIKYGAIPKAAYSSPAMPTHYLSVEQLAKWRKKALRKFYLRAPFIIQTLINCKSPKMLANYIKYGFAQLIDLLKK